jgi:2,3-bisphosphoglycerate-dependent phosphoglycerate mutase
MTNYSSAMQFYFIRHAESENNALYARTGATVGRVADPRLTELGRRQAQYLARFLREAGDGPADPHDLQNRGGFAFTHLYCSLMQRSIATALLVAQALALSLQAWPEIHEWGGMFLANAETGENEGLPGENRAFFATHFPDLLLPDSLGEAGWWNRPFESFADRPLRAQAFLRQLLERHGNSDDRVAVVSHGGFYSGFMRALFDLPPGDEHGEPAYRFALNNSALTRIDFVGDSIRLIYANRLDFLPSDLIT